MFNIFILLVNNIIFLIFMVLFNFKKKTYKINGIIFFWRLVYFDHVYDVLWCITVKVLLLPLLEEVDFNDIPFKNFIRGNRFSQMFTCKNSKFQSLFGVGIGGEIILQLLKFFMECLQPISTLIFYITYK